MTKNIFKEIIIILLLTLAIILLLGVLLYDYVPMNKVVPEKVTYVATEDVKNAISDSEIGQSNEVIQTYEVTATDLKNYKKGNEYKSGRKNPFAPVTSDGTSGSTGISNGGTSTGSGESSNNNGNTSSSTNTNTSSSTNSNSSSTNYYPDKGTK